MRRWLIRISIGVAALIVLVIVVVQLVLWSSLPKKIVLGQIEKELGLRISADSLSAGWFGNAELTNVTLGLPLQSSSFLTVKSLKIKLNSLIGLALGNAIAVDSITIDRPDVVIVQNSQGQWNLQQVADLLGKALGSNTAQQSTQSTGVPKLPIVSLIDGTVTITNNQKHTVTLAPLSVDGRPSCALVWKYDVKIAKAIAVTGVVAPGGNWQHQITLVVHDLDPLVKSWGIPTTYDAAVKAVWNGQFAGGKIVGNLEMDQVTAKNLPTLGNVSIGGSLDVQAAGGVVTVRPDKIQLTTGLPALPDIGVHSGSIVSDAAGIHAKSVKVSMLGGMANLDGQFNVATKDTQLQATWSGLSLANRTVQSGSLTASLRQPFANQPVIHVELNSDGTVGDAVADNAPSSRWTAKVDLTGQGTSWQTIDWVLAAPKLAYITPKQTYDLSSLSASVAQRTPAGEKSPVLELTDLSLPAPSAGSSAPDLLASAKIDFNTMQWHVNATDRFATHFQETPINVDAELKAHGSSKRFDLETFSLSMADTKIIADGSYDAGRSYDKNDPGPLALHVELSQSSRSVPNSPVQGTMSGEFKVVGDLFKKDPTEPATRPDQDPGFHFRPYLTTTGELLSNDLVVLGYPVGTVDIKLAGNTVTLKSEHPHTEIKSTDFMLFDAPWNISAVYPNKDKSLEIDLSVKRLSLEELSKVAKVPGITGEIASAKWSLVTWGTSLDAIDMTSEYHLAGVSAHSISADKIDANATLHQGVLQLNPLVARSGDGTTTTTATFDLNNARHLITETTVDHWPTPLITGAAAVTSAHTNLDIDLKYPKPASLSAGTQIGASGTLTATTDFLIHTGAKTTTLAHSHLDADIHNRAIEIKTLAGNVLNGTFTGEMNLDLNRPLEATGQVRWQNLDATTLATVIPGLSGFVGNFSGTITVAPATHEPRPLLPVRVDVNVASEGGHFRSVNIGGNHLLALHAVAYADVDRAILDHSDLYVAGGVVHGWGRVGTEGGVSSQVTMDFDNLDLNQLAHIEPSIKNPMPGRLSGHIGLIRSGPSASQLLAMGHLNLTQTDLVNFGPIAALYNIMNVGGGGTKPTGYGTVDMAFEQSTLRVTSFRFFNRGIDAYGVPTVGPINYTDFDLTPIGGQIAGTARPLKDTRVPLLADFDQVFSAFQSNLSTINIGGTIGNPSYTIATLADIGNAMRQLLVGSAESGQK
jgi:hypothetical protein